MKKIDHAKLPTDRKPAALGDAPEHDRAAAAFIAKIYRSGTARDRIDFFTWATLTIRAASLGGANQALHGLWVDEQVAQLAEVEAASELSADTKKITKRLAKQRDEAEGDIESLTKTIAELTESLTARRSDLAGVEAEQAQLDAARKLVEQVEDAGTRGNLLSTAWQFIRDGATPYDVE